MPKLNTMQIGERASDEQTAWAADKQQNASWTSRENCQSPLSVLGRGTRLPAACICCCSRYSKSSMISFCKECLHVTCDIDVKQLPSCFRARSEKNVHDCWPSCFGKVKDGGQRINHAMSGVPLVSYVWYDSHNQGHRSPGHVLLY